MSDQLVSLEISDESSLLRACDLLHDSKFDLSAMHFDPGQGTWRATFVREFFEDPALIESCPAFLVFTRYTFPLAESVLSLEGVSSCEVIDRGQIETFTFNECRCRDLAYRFFFVEDLEIRVCFGASLRGNLRDLRLLDERGSMLGWRRLGSRGLGA
jgi:hypothetical protein